MQPTATFGRRGITARRPEPDPEPAKPAFGAVLIDYLFSFEGRIGRLDFWLGEGVFTIVMLVVFLVRVFSEPTAKLSSRAEIVPEIDYLAFNVLMLWIVMALHVKRWHDRGKSGWWTTLSFIPVLGWVWSFIECGLLDGSPGPNRFGLSPKRLAF